MCGLRLGLAAGVEGRVRGIVGLDLGVLGMRWDRFNAHLALYAKLCNNTFNKTTWCDFSVVVAAIMYSPTSR